MEFLIVTGLSGAGKSRALHAMEDIGFYCMDNIPPKLIPAVYDLCQQAQSLPRVAVVTDIRGGDMFSSLFETLDEMQAAEKPYKILFLDASDTVLRNRFQETRRKHPLAEDTTGLEQAVKLEREILRPVRERADYSDRYVPAFAGAAQGAHFRPVFGRRVGGAADLLHELRL